MTYTKKEIQALDALRIYIREHRRCELSYDEIAKLAGVGKSTAMNAVLKAEGTGDLVVKRQLGDPHMLRLPQPGRIPG
jgi:transposase